MIEWYNLPAKDAYDLILLISISQYPPKLTAGKIIELSLDTFSSVSLHLCSGIGQTIKQKHYIWPFSGCKNVAGLLEFTSNAYRLVMKHIFFYCCDVITIITEFVLSLRKIIFQILCFSTEVYVVHSTFWIKSEIYSWIILMLDSKLHRK